MNCEQLPFDVRIRPSQLRIAARHFVRRSGSPIHGSMREVGYRFLLNIVPFLLNADCRNGLLLRRIGRRLKLKYRIVADATEQLGLKYLPRCGSKTDENDDRPEF
jgi:hypothetical protein